MYTQKGARNKNLGSNLDSKSAILMNFHCKMTILVLILGKNALKMDSKLYFCIHRVSIGYVPSKTRFPAFLLTEKAVFANLTTNAHFESFSSLK